MTPLVPVAAKVEIDTSPTAGGPWDGWRPYAPGTYAFWRCRMRVTVTGDGLRFVRLPRLVIRRRKFNRKDEGTLFLPGGAPIEVSFAAPAVVATLVGPSPFLGVKTEATAISKTRCRLEALDGTGASIPATVCWHAMRT